MKTLKKSLVLVLAFMMVVGVLAVAANADYVDIGQVTPEYREAIDVISGLGIVNGYPDGTLKPQGTITRAELAKILFVAITGKTDKAAADLYAGYNTFEDVPADQWYAGYVNYAASKNWVVGYGDGKFGPEDKVKGCDALVIILRILGYDKYDELKGDGYAIKAAETARNVYLLDVTDGLKVNYNAEATREEVFEYLYEALYVPFFQIPDSDHPETHFYRFVKDEKIPGYDGYPIETLGEKFGFEVAELQGVVEASQNTDPSLTEKVDKEDVPVTVLYDGTVLVDVNLAGADVGKTVSVRYDANEKDGSTVNKVYGVDIVSVEVTLDKALTSDKADKEELAKYEVADNLLVVNTAEQVISGTTTMADLLKKEGDVIAAGTYYGLVDAETEVTTLYAVVEAQQEVVFEAILVEENEDGDLVVDGKTFDEYAEEGTTVTPAIEKAGLYALKTEPYGDYYPSEVIEADFTGKVASVAKSGGAVTSITVDGKSYEVWKDTASVVVKNYLGDDPASVVVGTEYDFYLYDGKVVAVTEPDAIYGPEEDKPVEEPIDFDGFADIGAGRAVVTYTPAAEGDDWEGTEDQAAAYSVKYAKVNGLLDTGKAGFFNLEVKEGETTNAEGKKVPYAYVEIGGNEVVLYTVGDVLAEGDNVIDIAEAEDYFGYKLNGDTIELYAVEDLGVAGEEEYEVVSVVDSLAKNATTLVVDGTSYVVTNVDFVAFKDDEAVTFTGTAKIPGDSVEVFAVVLKSVTADSKTTTTVEFIFGGEVAAEAATANTDLVYIDVANVSESADADGNPVFSYTGVKSDGSKLTLTSATELATTGFYTYKSDNTVNALAETQPASTTAAFDSTGAYVLIDGTYYAVAGANVAEVAGEFANGCTFSYIISSTGALTDVWVTAAAE